MTEDRSRFHDVITKYLTIILAIGGFAIAIGTYVSQEAARREQNNSQQTARLDQEARFEVTRKAEADKEAATRKEDYKRRLWDKQMELYLQACRAASTIATVATPEHAEYATARLRFEQLYHGELCIVEEPKVSQAMVDFRNQMMTYEQSPRDEQRQSLRSLALNLAEACRKSTESVWDVKLGETSIDNKLNRKPDVPKP